MENEGGTVKGEGPSSGGTRRCIAKILLHLLIFLPAALAFLYVRSFGVNVAFWDQWEVVPLFDELFSGTLSFSDLFAQQGEFRMLFPRVAMLLLGVITDYNNVAEMYLVLACFVAALIVLLLAFRIDGRYRLFLFLPVPFLLFSPRQYENMLNGVQIVAGFVVLFSVVAFYCLHLSEETSLRKVTFTAALASATVASFSTAAGLLVWPVGWLQVLIVPAERSFKRLMVGFWGFIGLAEWIIYFMNYTKPEEHPPLSYALTHSLEGVEYILTLLGSSLFWDQGFVLIVGLLLVCLAAVVLWVVFKDGRLSERSFWLALLLFSSLSTAAIVAGRSGFGIEQAMTSRDEIFPLLAIISIYTLLAKPAVEKNSRVLTTLLGGMATLVLLSAPFAYVEGIGAGNRVKNRLEEQAFVLFTYQTQSDESLTGLYPFPRDLRARAPILERLGYNVFSDPPKKVDFPPLSEIETVNDQPVEQQSQPLAVAAGEAVINVSGWAVDAEAEEAAGGVYVDMDGKLFPTSYGTRRQDVTKTYKNNSYRNSGFEGFIPVSEIEAGTHKLSLLILTHDGKGYYRSEDLTLKVED